MTAENKKKTLVGLIAANTGLIAVGLVVSCLSWFSITNKFTPPDVYSSVVTSYFDSKDGVTPADGTQENPFVIDKPVHYYNLVGLHHTDKEFTINGTTSKFYAGGYWFEFGRDFDGDGDKEFYSYDDAGVLQEGVYTNYLNMSYYFGDNALKPLGTATRPFMGHIRGNNLTVQNLHIDGTGFSDVGIFGYVDGSASIEYLYFDSTDIDARNLDATEGNELYHKSHAFANVGYIAGHVAKNDSFVHVYINNCKIRNSVSNSTTHNNDYGYFGFAEGNSNPVPAGEASNYEFNPDKIYEYLDTNYNSIKGNNLVLRNDYSGTGSGQLTNAISHGTSGGSHYTINGHSSADTEAPHDYAWSSIGYEEGDSINNVWYKEAEQYRSLPKNTAVVEDEPLMAGDYLYYDGEKWDFYQNTASSIDASGRFGGNKLFFIDQKPDLTKELWTWFWSSSRHYVKRNGDRVVLDANNGQDLTFVDRPGVSGNLDSDYIIRRNGTFYYRSDVCRTIYVMDHMPSEQVKKVRYLYVQRGTNNLVWGEYKDAADSTKSLSCAFTVSTLMGGAFYFYVGSVKYTVGYTGGVLKAAPVGQITPVYFVFGGGSAENAYDLSSDNWKLVKNASELKDNDEVTFVYSKSYANLQSGDVDVMAAKQSSNYRKSVPNDALKETIGNNPEGAVLKIKKNADGTFSFLDDDNGGGYLIAHSSVYDSLRVGPIYDNNSHFKLTFTNNYEANLVAQGDSTHNKLRFDKDTMQFNCFEEDKAMVYIFKKVKNGFRNIFYIGSYEQGCWANYAGVETNTHPVYYSAPGTTNYTILTDDPDTLGEFNFDASGYESTSTVEMSSGAGSGLEDGWVRCMEMGDLEDGAEYIIATYTYDNCATAGQLAAGGFTALNGSLFGGNGKVIIDLDPQAMHFTLHGNNTSGFTFEKTGGGGLLGATGYDNINMAGEGETRWNISFASNFFVTIENFAEDYGTIRFNDEQQKFTTMMLGKNILLYKHTNEMADVTFLSDEIIDPRYDASVIDAIGGCSFYSDYVQLDKNENIKSVLYHDTARTEFGKTGDIWFPNYSLGDAIVCRIPNNGSLDFGTLTVEGEGEAPEFLKGWDLDVPSIGFGHDLIKCENSSNVAGTFKFVLSMNVYNIKNISYCSLQKDENDDKRRDKILSSYDITSGQLTPDGTDIDRTEIDAFVLALGCTSVSNKTKISKVSYTFNAAQGNMIDFGLVGYRTAVYEGGETDNLGNRVKSISQVKGPIMNFEYVLNGEGYVYVEVEYIYNQAYGKYIYNIKFKSSVATTLILFNYDAQKELVSVNGQLRTGAFIEIPIAASEPPIGGWTK